jgi:hypothetical protein
MTPKTRNIDLVCSGICLAENVAIVFAQCKKHPFPNPNHYMSGFGLYFE